jgi:hypothetical protein
MWSRIENLKAGHHGRECLAVINDLVTMLAAACRGVTDICTMVTAGPMDLTDKAKILETGMAVLCAAALHP